MTPATKTAPAKKEFGNISDLVRHFRDLPGISELEAEAARKIEDARRETAQRLAELRVRRHGPDALALAKARDAGYSALRAAHQKADRLIAAAAAEAEAAQARLVGHEWGCDIEIHRLERHLAETSDARIGEFIEWAYTESNVTMKQASMLIGRVRSHKDPFTDEETLVRAAEPGAERLVDARLAALRKAIDAAEALRLVADVDVTAALEQLRATIPAFD